MSIPDGDSLTHRIIGLAMRVRTRLGPGLLEGAYEHCLCHEFDLHGFACTRQVDLPLGRLARPWLPGGRHRHQPGDPSTEIRRAHPAPA